MSTKTSKKPVVGDVGIAVSKLCGTHAGDSMTVSVTNDVGGHSSLPEGRYPVRITKTWDDYETGRRMIGELLFPKDIETARKAGTTGRTAEEYAKYGADHVEKVKKAAAAFDPKTVYFHGDDFTTEPKTTIVNGAIVTEIEIDENKTNDQLERESHEYTIKGVKTFRGMDGQGLNATLYRGDKKVALILDEGCGGEMSFDFLDFMHGKSKEEDLFEIFIAEQKLKADDTKKDEFGHTERFYFDGAHWVNTSIDDMMYQKSLRRACKTKTLFQVGDKIGTDSFMQIKGVDLKTRQYIEKKYAGQKLRILNDEIKD
jgi:hypothetical protein